MIIGILKNTLKRKLVIWKVIFLMSGFSILTGLTGVPGAEVKEFSYPSKITFCVGWKPACQNLGVRFIDFFVSELDEYGDRVRDVWVLKSETESRSGYIKQLTYGVVPLGFKEDFPAINLSISSLVRKGLLLPFLRLWLSKDHGVILRQAQHDTDHRASLL